MTHIKKQLRPGATALAFALAFSTTPLLAQTATQPVVTLPTPAPPTAAPAPALPTPVAPTVRAATPAPAPVTVPEARAETRAAPGARTRTATTTRRTQAATRTAAPTAPAVAQAEPVAPAPVVPLAETPLVEPAPVVTETTPVEPVAADDGNDMLPIAGGAAGLLLLAGGAYALSRRRRNADEEDYPAETWEQDHVAYADPAVAAEPTWREPTPVAAPAMAAAALPAGMDLSRYGRHVQAAYAGPTEDNPSLSLKRRLKRAAFFDQRERMAREAGEPSDMVKPVATPQAAASPAPQREQLVTSRRVSPKAGTQALFGFRPTFQN